MGVLWRENRGAAMDGLGDELLGVILKKLSLHDAIRARAVCKRWRTFMNEDKSRFKFAKSHSYCPLLYKLIDRQHTWSGYHGATGEWEALPSLSNVPRCIELVPIAGSGNGLLGFKTLSEFSCYVVGNPYSQKWTTLPRSTSDCWGDAAMFMTSSDEQGQFRVVAVRDEDTHIYKSESEMWMKVGLSPNCVRKGNVVSRVKKKIGAVVCNDCLYIASADGNVLISFDVCSEKWMEDRIGIPLPNSARKSMQLVECAGTLFAVTECEGNVAVWGFVRNKFSLTAEIPVEIQRQLTTQATECAPDSRRGSGPMLKTVGHGHHVYFWRKNSLRIIAYDLFTREWFLLPEVVRPDNFEAGDKIVVDAGFFEPRLPSPQGGTT